MIKLFRNIRKNLLAEGKTSKYLKYAIGEILLVVVGILIALSINNWNKHQTNKKEEVFYLQKLRQNLEQDTLYLSKRLKQLVRHELVHDSLINQINDSTLQNFSSTGLVYNLVYTFGFSPQTSTFDNLISTGKLDLMRNQTFVDSLFVYYNDLNNYTKQRNESIGAYARNTFGPYIAQFDDIENPKLRPMDYGAIPFFKNAIWIRKKQLAGLKYDYEATSVRCRNLINFINEQLE